MGKERRQRRYWKGDYLPSSSWKCKASDFAAVVDCISNFMALIINELCLSVQRYNFKAAPNIIEAVAAAAAANRRWKVSNYYVDNNWMMYSAWGLQELNYTPLLLFFTRHRR